MKKLTIVTLSLVLFVLASCAGGPRGRFGHQCIDVKKELNLSESQNVKYKSIGKMMRKQMSKRFSQMDEQNDRLSKFVKADEKLTVKKLKDFYSKSKRGPSDNALKLIVDFHNSLSVEQKGKMATLIEDGKMSFGPKFGRRF